MNVKWFLLRSILCLVVTGIFTGVHAQSENITSKIYFPGSIGLNKPFDNDKLNLSSGTMLTTALEYRPLLGNAVFIRFNYDAVHNHYRQVYSSSPTNVNTGKLSTNIFSFGLGYRYKVG